MRFGAGGALLTEQEEGLTASSPRKKMPEWVMRFPAPRETYLGGGGKEERKEAAKKTFSSFKFESAPDGEATSNICRSHLFFFLSPSSSRRSILGYLIRTPPSHPTSLLPRQLRSVAAFSEVNETFFRLSCAAMVIPPPPPLNTHSTDAD